MKNLAKIVEVEPCFMIGAGAGPWVSVGKNCEMMANVFLGKETIKNCTYIAKVRNSGNEMDLETVPESETRFALLANLFCCEGKPCKVLKVNCKQRTGADNFISSVRASLTAEYKDKPVGLGGTFLIKSGKAKLHVMPDFSKEPLTSDDALNKWLRFFEVPAPLVGVGTLVSSEIKGLDLRVQHFHTFSDHGEGGHYHYDVTPDDVEYLGYFSVAEKIFRIDKPLQTHQMGRD
ncbi:hypothetical protein AAG570_000123 [Ranatra chinensis]|uniref:DUF1907 domain-containing protein n=1 Tax=Ranatra chinensis TaxID=642074 RepID=A0ABD0YW56_9HEMI